MTTLAQRKKIASLIDYFTAHEPQIHYLQHRPMLTAHLSEAEIKKILSKKNGGLALDCSEYVTMLCRLAGLHSPSGPHFPYLSGAGNTETIYDYLPHYEDPSHANIGAIVIFAYDLPLSFQHAAIVKKPHKTNPILSSHGWEGGPQDISLLDEAKYHKGHWIFCNISKL